MIKLLYKIIILSLPLLILLLTYFYYDPFEIIYKYRDHYKDAAISHNRDFITTDVFLNNYDSYHYDSFIFGNSRSRSFRCAEWTKYISDSSCFHFDAADESIFGIYKKIIWLDKRKTKIRNCILAIDFQTLSKIDNHIGHLYIKHPITSGESNIVFHEAFIRAYSDPRFLFGYLDYKYNNKIRSIFSSIFEQRIIIYNNKNCDTYVTQSENEISNNLYYNKRASDFYVRSTNSDVYDKSIYDIQYKMLSEIRDVFIKNNTDYYIIINPLYDQKYFNKGDLFTLKKIFKADRIYDYSGVNKFTNSKYNYYDVSHFRPCVGDSILKKIYTGKQDAICQ